MSRRDTQSLPPRMEPSFLHLLVLAYSLKTFLVVGDTENAAVRATGLALSEKGHSFGVGLVEGRLQAEESDVPRKSHLSSPLSRRALLSRKAAYDLCVVGPEIGWLSSGKAARFASACLRPGGWLVLVRALAGPELFLHAEQSDRRRRQVNTMFRHLVSVDPKLHNSLRIGGLYVAQRVDTNASSPKRDPEIIKFKMRVVHAAIDLSTQDPDFRRALLDEPQSALSSLAAKSSGGRPFPHDLFARLIFHDSDLTRSRFQPVAPDHLHLIIPSPVWHRPITESELDALLASAKQPPRNVTRE